MRGVKAIAFRASASPKGVSTFVLVMIGVFVTGEGVKEILDSGCCCTRLESLSADLRILCFDRCDCADCDPWLEIATGAQLEAVIIGTLE